MGFFQLYYKSYACFILFACFFLSIESKAEVVLKDFEVTSKGNFIVIQWKTASESDIRGFYLLSSSDNKNYEVLGKLIPCLKCNTEGANYSTTHIQALPGRTYSYVLKSANNTGESILTDPITFTFNQASESNDRATAAPSFQSARSDSTAILDPDAGLNNQHANYAYAYANTTSSNAKEIQGNSSGNLQNEPFRDKPLRNHSAGGSMPAPKGPSVMGMVQYFKNSSVKTQGLLILGGIIILTALWTSLHFYKRLRG
jgi:hypothetical protein